MKIYKIQNNELAIICENICSLYEAGISFLTIFELLEELKLSKNYNLSLKFIKNSIREGATLKEGFENYRELYPKFFIAMISIGEKTGRLSEVLRGVGLYYNKIHDIKNALINALTYPVILIISAVIMMCFLLINVVPTFGDIYLAMGKEMPKVCNIVINISTYVKRNLIETIIMITSWFILTPIIIYYMFLKDFFVKLLYKVTIIKEISEYISVMLLSIIIRSGINLTYGLQLCSLLKLFNNLNNNFHIINEEIMKGKSLSESMEVTSIFSKYTLVHVRLGEESGSLSNRLTIIEEELYKKVISKLNRGVQLIGPILIVLIGTTLLMFIVIFILPLFDVMMKG